MTDDLYRHYKGGLYRLLHMASLESDETPVVVYQDKSSGRVWVRTEDEFFETIRDGKAANVPRFAKVSP